jgi:hypothetical protein
MKIKIYLLSTIWLALLCAPAWAAPPYDATISFAFPATTIPIDTVDLYMNDCALGAPVGLPFGQITSGQTFPALITTDGTYEFCVRGVNAAGISAGPGAVWIGTIAQLNIPPDSDSINVQIPCDTPCVINFTIEQR